jgi:two-component system cell cycle sensor histidine kinase/response regulator CckA
VEDAPEVALAVAAMLESRGWCVDCAANEAEALSLLRGSARFGLIVSDFRLGGPIDGIELLQRARLLQPGSRCILTTADTGTSPRARAECAGFEFLPKPLRPESFS